MSKYYSKKIYEGPEIIVVAMDIGTTQSAVSFAHFFPGSQPQGKMVAHWPGLAHWSGAAKIPSIVSYRDGVVKACGVEAMRDFREDERNVAYWFKLHVHPKRFYSQAFEIPPLPTGITIEQVYTDLMKYLMENTRQFFEMTTANGAEIWRRVRDGIVIVLATPNGWDIREQAALRKAAITASLVTEENAGQLLQFMTESEASVHYALAQASGEWLRRKTVFAVIDCGGSTVDTAVYRCASISPLSLKETCPSKCVQLKPTFDGVMEEYDFKFSGNRDNDPNLGINKGRMTLSNQELKPVFDAVIDKIVASCVDTLVSQKVEYVLLVGGFAESPYVRNVLSKSLSAKEIQMVTVGDCTKKAAAEGAIIGYIEEFVVARAAKATFGGCVRQRYEKKLHKERRHAVQVYADGKERVDGVFHVWIKKDTILQGTFAHTLRYHVAWDAASTPKSELIRGLETVEIEVFAWESDDIPPTWCKDEHGSVMKGMRLICTLKADLSALAGVLQTQTGSHRRMFYRVDYNVCVYFGGTQLRANLQWKEKGVLRQGPVTVVPDASESKVDR